MKIKILIFLSFFYSSSYAQFKTNVDIDVIVSKLKTLYAGYRDKVKNQQFEKLVSEVKMSNEKDTFKNLSRLTLYFNDHHLRLFQKFTIDDIDKNICKENLKKISNPRKKKSILEGYWINDLNSMVVYLYSNNKTEYSAYLIESKNNIEKGFCTFRIVKNLQNELITDYYSILRGRRVFIKSKLYNDSTLFCNSFSKWKRITNYQSNFLNSKIEIQKIPKIDSSDSNNVIITMPSFNRDLRKVYDSLIALNINKISQSKNLIIDIRNNNGGTINCFSSLLPYICTDTIRDFGGYRIINDEVIESIKSKGKSVLESKDSSRIRQYYKFLEEMNYYRDSLHYYQGGIFFPCIAKSNKIKNVALIINDRCLSAAELMVLYLKQSRKVKIFGENTGGGVDYINAPEFILPKSGYMFWVATSKREITTQYPSFDGKGIQPDIKISENVTDWIKFVKEYYGQN
jgi:hypothetical protein